MKIVGFTGAINHGKTSAANSLRASAPNSRHIESWQIIAEVVQELNSHFDRHATSPQDLVSINSWFFNLIEILDNVAHIKAPFEKIEVHEHEVEKQYERFNKLFTYIDRLRDNPDMTREEIDESNKENHRPILQFIGGYIPEHLGETVWFDEIVRRISSEAGQLDLYTVSGLRYPADERKIRNIGGVVIEVKRPDHNEADTNDPTEASRQFIDPDTIVINNGSIEDLSNVMKAVWEDLKNDSLRFEYRAA